MRRGVFLINGGRVSPKVAKMPGIILTMLMLHCCEYYVVYEMELHPSVHS